MTRIEFYFNVTDKLAKATELCERAVAKGRQLTVFTQDDAMSSVLQQKLWQHTPTSFLPSAYPYDATSAHTPIIVDAVGSQLIQDDILINLKA